MKKVKKILIASPLAPDGKRGTYYSRMLRDELVKLGHHVVYVKFDLSLPVGIRHVWFFLKLVRHAIGADVIAAFDTFSVALPSVWAGQVTRTKTIIRVGGDYLWETYVNRTNDAVLYKDFYTESKPMFTFKEKVIKRLSGYMYRYVTGVIFSTCWQREIMREAYPIPDSKVYYIDNFIGPREFIDQPSQQRKNYLCIGREHKTKNTERLKEAFALAKEQVPDIELDMFTDISQLEVLERMKNCYAYIGPALSEFSPNLPLEALLYGKPVILTKESGYSDMLKDHVTLFDPLSVSELTQAIVELAGADGYQKALKRARSFTGTQSYEAIAKEFISISNSL